MNYSEWAESFMIFAKYEKEDGRVFATRSWQGDGEIISGSTPPEEMTPEDAQYLQSRGWFWSTDYRAWKRYT